MITPAAVNKNDDLDNDRTTDTISGDPPGYAPPEF
jgi:hypothetical protein